MRSLAEDLHAYIMERARVENVPYTLTPEKFEEWLADGVKQFFGVRIKRGEIVSDKQEPWLGFLDTWKKQ
jgi:hypothetical protein